jgi:hypothetical protein
MPFIINIVDENGNQVQLKPGGVAEYNLIKEIRMHVARQNLSVFNIDTVLRELRKRKIGYFSSEDQVLDAVKDVLSQQSIDEWEDKILNAVSTGVREALLKIKSDVKPV